MNKALFTANYRGIMCSNTRDSLQDAAARWGARYCEFTEENHAIHLHPATVKMEALDLVPDAEAIFIVDADAIIRSDCPSPFENWPGGQLGVVGISQRIDPTGSIRECGRWEWSKMLRLADWIDYVPHDSWRYFNSGIILAFRDKHEEIFDLAMKISRVPNDLGWIEQTPLNYAAKKLRADIHYAAEAWNYISPEGMNSLNGDFSRLMPAWICHFAGCPGRESFMQHIRWRL